jgi:hypothetical protein
MFDIDPEVDAAVTARNEGRYADALLLQQSLFARAGRPDAPGPSAYFMAMFGWDMLLPEHPPARPVLEALRDEQVRRLQDGDAWFGAPQYEGGMPKQRFSVIVELNALLEDAQSTCALFSAIDRSDPAAARKYAAQAMPALVACAAWPLAARYRGEPLRMLGECIDIARTFPLFPPPGVAPRLGATLTGLVRDVHLDAAVLDGLGEAEAAQALRAALIDGIEDPAMRALAQRELAVPGTISHELVAHQMAQGQPAAQRDN